MLLKNYVYKKSEFKNLLSSLPITRDSGKFESALSQIYDKSAEVLQSRDDNVYHSPIISLAEDYCSSQPFRVVLGYAVTAELILLAMRPERACNLTRDDILVCNETIQGADVMLHCASLLAEYVMTVGRHMPY